MVKKKVIPRGIRNNNPLNIRIGNTWLGEVSNPTDPTFEQFVSMMYGVRAAFILIRRYIRHYHRDTVATIIYAWAPTSENQTIKYIDTVCGIMNIEPYTRVTFEDRDTMVALFQAMSMVEVGQRIPDDVVLKGYDAA